MKNKPSIFKYSALTAFICIAAVSRSSFLSDFFLSVDRAVGSYVSLLPFAHAHDQGLISFFQKDCPEGWVPHEKSKGRLIKGTSFDFETEQLSGSDGHILTIDEMPRHNHFMFTITGTGQPHEPSLSSYQLNTRSTNLDYLMFGTNSVPTHGILSSTGSGQPFSTIPDHIKLKICEKNSINAQYRQYVQLNEDLADHIADFNQTVAEYQAVKAQVTYYTEQLQQKRKELDSLKKYSPALHIIGIIALIFVLINIVFWVISFSKYSKVARVINDMRADDAGRAIDSER